MKTCVITFGRFNPVHQGHGKLLHTALDIHQSNPYSELKIYASTSEGKDNILPYEFKLDMIEEYYPWTAQYIQEEHSSTLFGILEELDESYSDIIIVSGSDRSFEFQKLLEKYNGLLYTFDSITSVCAGQRDDNKFSSTNVRKSIMNKDFGEFCSLMPCGSFGKNKKYFNEICQIMGVK
jgi:FAD synthase